MGFKLVRPAEGFLHPGTFLKKFTYSDDNERQYVRQVAKLAINRKTRIHLLANNANIPCGFTALSISHLLDQSCLVVDYLFTSKEHRGIAFDDLGMKISEYLVDFAIKGVAMGIKSVEIVRSVRDRHYEETKEEVIVAFIETECSRLDTIIDKFKKQIELFKEYRTTLISELVTGKIDVRDEVAA